MIREPYGTWLAIRPFLFSMAFLCSAGECVLICTIPQNNDVLPDSFITLSLLIMLVCVLVFFAQYSATIRSWLILPHVNGDDLKNLLDTAGLGLHPTLVAQAIPVLLERKERICAATQVQQWEDDSHRQTSVLVQRPKPVTHTVAAWLRRRTAIRSCQLDVIHAKLQRVISTGWQAMPTYAIDIQEYSVSFLVNVLVRALKLFPYKQQALAFFCSCVKQVATSLPEIQPCIAEIAEEYGYISPQNVADETLSIMQALTDVIEEERDQQGRPPRDDTLE